MHLLQEQEIREMKLQMGKPSCVISWIVGAALITSPLMAQNPPATDRTVNASEEVANDSAPQVSNENREAVVDGDVNAVASVTVTLSNSQGASEPKTAQ